jgi:hypothetical protein
MKKTLLTLLVLSITFYSFAEKVAQVNMDKLSPLLRLYIFKNDRALEKLYKEATNYTKNALKNMKVGKDGKITFDFSQKDLMKSINTDRYKITGKVDELVLRNLTIILTEMKLDYDLIIKSNNDDAILFSKQEINDITQIVYQEIIIRLVGNKSSTPKPTKVVSAKGLNVQGAVITKYQGKYFYYKKKCTSCGFVSPQRTGSGYPPAPWKMRSKFICPKCNKITEVVIQRSR